MTEVVNSYYLVLAHRNTAAMLRKQKIGETSASITHTRKLYRPQHKAHLRPSRTIFPFWYLGNLHRFKTKSPVCCQILDAWRQVLFIFFPQEYLCLHCFYWSELQWQMLSTCESSAIRFSVYRSYIWKTATSISMKRLVHYHIRISL